MFEPCGPAHARYLLNQGLVVLDNPLLMAFGLMLVLEGVLPLLAPRMWRQTFRRMLELNDGQLRFVGLASLAGGMLVLFVLR